jgi:GTP-binding protein HflX
VELAQLKYMMPRLIGSAAWLSRLGGGIGTRGPGETKLETDRRHIRHRLAAIGRQIADVKRRRAQLRDRRREGLVPTVALVGYTNAGKTTLFNRVAQSKGYAADQLFATLDTTTRRVYLGEGAQVALSDTVGFIRDLPHTLVDAFRATLEETIQADLLLHVVDAANPARDEHIASVDAVLEEIGAADVPQLLVFNQIDRVPGMLPEVVRDSSGKILNIKVSAATGAGIDGLREVLAEAARESSLPTAA